MLIKVPDRKTVHIANLKRYAYERQGWCKVTEGKVGPRAFHCACANPCGFRAFPGVERLKDLMWSDIMLLWRRALRAQGTLPGGVDSIEQWEKKIAELKRSNRKMRDAGLVTKHSPIMLLAKIPGPVIRGLAHDFPNEFSPTLGATSADINCHLERVLDALYINRERGTPIGAVKRSSQAVLLG